MRKTFTKHGNLVINLSKRTSLQQNKRTWPHVISNAKKSSHKNLFRLHAWQNFVVVVRPAEKRKIELRQLNEECVIYLETAITFLITTQLIIVITL